MVVMMLMVVALVAMLIRTPVLDCNYLVLMLVFLGYCKAWHSLCQDESPSDNTANSEEPVLPAGKKASILLHALVRILKHHESQWKDLVNQDARIVTPSCWHETVGRAGFEATGMLEHGLFMALLEGRITPHLLDCPCRLVALQPRAGSERSEHRLRISCRTRHHDVQSLVASTLHSYCMHSSGVVPGSFRSVTVAGDSTSYVWRDAVYRQARC